MSLVSSNINKWKNFIKGFYPVISLVHSGVHQQRANPEPLLLEAVKQVKVSDFEDDILELPEDDPAAAGNQLDKHLQIEGFIRTDISVL